MKSKQQQHRWLRPFFQDGRDGRVPESFRVRGGLRRDPADFPRRAHGTNFAGNATVRMTAAGDQLQSLNTRPCTNKHRPLFTTQWRLINEAADC